MNDLISRQAAIDAKKRYIEVGKIPWRCAPNTSPPEPFVTITDVKNMPDADVVEVVRCKDCRYSQFKEEPGWYLCDGNSCEIRDGDYYCASGKRKEKTQCQRIRILNEKG